MECEIENDIQLLKKYITNKDRLLHCVSTAENMARYASLFSIDYNTAYFCGLYHDLAKELSPQEMLDLTESFTNQIMNFTLVSEQEADFMAGKLAVKTPIGQALMGHGVGEVVEAKVPAGVIKFEILDITL